MPLSFSILESCSRGIAAPEGKGGAPVVAMLPTKCKNNYLFVCTKATNLTYG